MKSYFLIFFYKKNINLFASLINLKYICNRKFFEFYKNLYEKQRKYG